MTNIFVEYVRILIRTIARQTAQKEPSFIMEPRVNTLR
jgi:hypothetical protein